MTTVAEAAWDRWEARVRAEGIEQGIERGVRRGIAQGGAQIISRQAALKFGTTTAKRLDDLLKGRTTPKVLDTLNAWILECNDSDKLLSRVSSLPTNRRE